MRRLPLREKMIRVGQSKETLEFLDSKGCVVSSSPEKTAEIGKDKKTKLKKKPIVKAAKAKRAPPKLLIPQTLPYNPNQNLYTDVM